MKKRVITIVLAVFICVASVIPAFAENGFDDAFYRIVDNANILTTSESDELTEKINEIRVRQNMDIAIMTTETLNGKSLQEFADYVYENNYYGYGENADGVMLLIDMESRSWYITTSGYGTTVFTDLGIEYIGEHMAPFLSDGNYPDAFNMFAEKCDELITTARVEGPYGSNFESQDSTTSDDAADEPLSIIWIPISIAIGVVVALIVVKGMKSDLKSVKKKREANSYVRNGSMVVNENYDTFLYSQVTKTEIQKQNDSGSTTHTSSSGNTHGGGGGSF